MDSEPSSSANFFTLTDGQYLSLSEAEKIEVIESVIRLIFFQGIDGLDLNKKEALAEAQCYLLKLRSDDHKEAAIIEQTHERMQNPLDIFDLLCPALRRGVKAYMSVAAARGDRNVKWNPLLSAIFSE